MQWLATESLPRAAAPVPITSATPVSSHTRRSTVKSRKAEGRDLIGPPRQRDRAHESLCAPKPVQAVAPARLAPAHDPLSTGQEPACLCASLAKSLASYPRGPQCVPAGLRALSDQQVQPYCCVSIQAARPRTRLSRLYPRERRDLQEKLMLLRLQSCFQRCAFAEVQKAAQFITKLRQCSEQRIRSAFRGSSDHLYIVARYIFRILLAFNQRSKIPSWHL